jgi:hypothetical protein
MKQKNIATEKLSHGDKRARFSTGVSLSCTTRNFYYMQMKATCDEERMERGAFLAEPQNCQSVWTVCNEYERFCGAVRYYNNDSSVTVRQYDTFRQGLLKGRPNSDWGVSN